MNAAPLESATCASIVTYNPDAELRERLRRVGELGVRRVVADNSTTVEARAAVAALCQEEGVDYVDNGGNLGVATALNVCLRWARDAGYGWLLTFDQDSIPSLGLLEVYGGILARAADPELVGAIGVALGKRARRMRRAGLHHAEVDGVITSGCLMRVEAALGIGGYWDELFIDGVDTEICIRLREAGLRVLATSQPVLEHRIGSERPLRFLGRDIQVSDHDPERRFHMARNRLWIRRRHGGPVSWRILLRDGVFMPLFERRTTAKILSTLRGIKAGALDKVPL
ncbi:MAG: glycosyltransferase [Thermoanaerobaculia bacterium]|nr:glycosyltransferase [Thermoanaerobaculia bacterium]